MAKRKQANRGPTRATWPAWVWLLSGVLLGLGLALLVLMKDWAPALRNRNQPHPNPEARAPSASEPALVDQADKPKAKKTFDFYSVLPEMEVVIPDAELSARAREPAAEAANVRYLLQAGSFNEGKDAEAAKARLALLGIVARVQIVTIDGKTWHRVRVGPYASARELEAAKLQLADAGIAAMALKEKTD